jgi:hypothetical protein
MCSEELRLDLESFINKGLNKGLRGWPVKGPECPAACRFGLNSGRKSPQLYVGGDLTSRMNLGVFGFVRAQC